MENSYEYQGSELALFAEAKNWKSYVRSQLKAYLGETVIEVGAGRGAFTELLAKPPVRRWYAVEPDPAMGQELRQKFSNGGSSGSCAVEAVTVTLAESGLRDASSVLYCDVLEHIEDHEAEVEAARKAVAIGGHVIVLAPAHQFLYSEFDKAVGHYRRYSKATLSTLFADAKFKQRKLAMLDTVGLAASLGNRLVLRQSVPSKSQIMAWDRVMVPLSRAIDPLLAFSFGKSVLGVWERLA